MMENFQNPYGAPGADVRSSALQGDVYAPRIWSVSGRIGRVRYVAYGMFFAMIIFALMIVAAMLKSAHLIIAAMHGMVLKDAAVPAFAAC